ncbi:MAG: hypothetical protein BGN83_21215 [Rhizobium sp. 63-7]|nr:MAG: hypothetical protein BGN83_21215 [Rhizobium sp. 63-7]
MKGAQRSAIGQLLIYPALSVSWIGESHKRHARAPLLSYDDARAYDAVRAGDSACIPILH